MRVLLSTDTVGGVWDYSVTLARGLHDAGFEVLLAVIGEPRDERLAALPAGCRSRGARAGWSGCPTRGGRGTRGEWLRDLARLWRADVVHLNQMAYAARDFPCPVVTCVHSDVVSWHAEAEGRLHGGTSGRSTRRGCARGWPPRTWWSRRRSTRPS
jgi:hypothetical protein